MEQLRLWRQEGAREAQAIADIVEQQFPSISRLGDEQWAVYEQAFIACLDLPNKAALAERCLNALRARFPSSSRVRRLEAMVLEADGRLQDAIEAYDVILKEHEFDAATMKRKIAVHLASGQVDAAIKSMNQYLKLYAKDSEAWQQLAEIYIDLRNYELAAFCLEELILLQPYNHIYCTTYAEILYTRGGFDNFLLARKYFARALELNPDSLRAKIGLLATAKCTRETGQAKASEDDDFSVDDLLCATQQQVLRQLQDTDRTVFAASQLCGSI